MSAKAIWLILSTNQLNQVKQNKVKMYYFRPSGHGRNIDFVFKLFSSSIRFGTDNMELCMHACYYDYQILNSAYFNSQNALKLRAIGIFFISRGLPPVTGPPLGDGIDSTCAAVQFHYKTKHCEYQSDNIYSCGKLLYAHIAAWCT
jgi:hypothetical protein